MDRVWGKTEKSTSFQVGKQYEQKIVENEINFFFPVSTETEPWQADLE